MRRRREAENVVVIIRQLAATREKCLLVTCVAFISDAVVDRMTNMSDELAAATSNDCISLTVRKTSTALATGLINHSVQS